MVFHCDKEWNVLGVAGGNASVEAAKEWVERSYKGLLSKWVHTGTTQEEVISYLNEQFSDESCSFCGKWPLRVDFIFGEKARICNYRVETFYEIAHKAQG